MNKKKKKKLKNLVLEFIKSHELFVYEVKDQNNFIFNNASVKKYTLSNTDNNVLFVSNNILNTEDIINKVFSAESNTHLLVLNSLYNAELLIFLLDKLDLKAIKDISEIGNIDFFLWDKIFSNWTMIIAYLKVLSKNVENIDSIKLILNKYSGFLSNYNVKIILNMFEALKANIKEKELEELFLTWCKNHKDYLIKKDEILNAVLIFIQKNFKNIEQYENLLNKNIKQKSPLKVEMKNSLHMDIDLNVLYQKYKISFEKVKKNNYQILLLQFLKDFEKSSLIQNMNIDILNSYRPPNNLVLVISSKNNTINNHISHLVDLFINEICMTYQQESILFNIDVRERKKLININKNILKKLEIIYNHETTKVLLKDKNIVKNKVFKKI